MMLASTSRLVMPASLYTDEDVSSSDVDDDEDSVSACSQDSGACTADSQEPEDGVESTDEECSSSASSSDYVEAVSSSGPASGTAATAGAMADGGFEQVRLGCCEKSRACVQCM
jgi:hypothetical protein